MAALIEHEVCPTCGKLHSFYFADGDYFSATGRYEYTCPETGRQSIIRPSVANRIVSLPPPGTVQVRRVDLPD